MNEKQKRQKRIIILQQLLKQLRHDAFSGEQKEMWLEYLNRERSMLRELEVDEEWGKIA